MSRRGTRVSDGQVGHLFDLRAAPAAPLVTTERPLVRAGCYPYTPDRDLTRFRSCVSLHAHTHYSRETISELTGVVAGVPLVAAFLERGLHARLQRTAARVDFANGYWTPPCSPRDVFESELAQIESRFGLEAIVSITDHDMVAAGVDLQQRYARTRAPISNEWTVPFGDTYVHLGIHNLPPASAVEWWHRMGAYTRDPKPRTLAALLAELDETPDVLIVFNHPIWDLASIGAAAHHRWLARFLRDHGHCMHAIELNGYRSQAENDEARRLARTQRLPIVSGGDRHGCDPNALLNLTAARTMSEFVQEVRDGLSYVVVMPEYRRHLFGRMLASVADVLGHRPGSPAGSRYWTDRVFCQTDAGPDKLSKYWPKGGPLPVRSVFGTIQLAARRPLLNVICAAATIAERARPAPTRLQPTAGL